MKNINCGMIVLMLTVCVFLNGCIKPYQKPILEEIKPNETAFLIPLEGDAKSTQAKFDSVEFLSEKKIAAKRIEIPTRWIKTGYYPNSGEYKMSAMLIRVDRAPVTRQWTGKDKPEGNAIQVESSDSIGFGVGITVTARIPEDQTPQFLYNFSGKSLDEIIDKNVRGKVTEVLSREFGTIALNECGPKKSLVMTTMQKEVTEFFKPVGIDITTISLQGGLEYDPTIQKNIDETFAANMKVKVATEAAKAQEILNEQNVNIAIAEREAAEEFKKAQDALAVKIDLEIQKKYADAAMAAAEKWDGKMPANMVPSGAFPMLNIGGPNSNNPANKTKPVTLPNGTVQEVPVP
jgi:hypothetical protein